MPETTPTQVRLDSERVAALHDASKYTGLTIPETHRKALDYGLPIVKKKIGPKKKSERVS